MPTRSGDMVLGIDLGGAVAMTAAAAYWPDVGRLEGLVAFPSDPSLLERGQKDGVDDLYCLLEQSGELRLCGNRAIDYVEFLYQCKQYFGTTPSVIVADRYKKNELLDALERSGYPIVPTSFRGQFYKEAHEDLNYFRKFILDKKLSVDKSIMWRSSIGGAVVVTDTQGNQKLARNIEGGRRLNHKDDLVAAALLAVAEGYRRYGARGESRIVNSDGVRYAFG